MLINCHECGGEVSTEADTCMKCGAPPRKVIKCGECGEILAGHTGVCRACGAPAGKAKKGLTLPSLKSLIEQDADSSSVPLNQVDYVTFDTARYQVYCFACKSRFFIKGSALKTNDRVRCPNHETELDTFVYKVTDLRIIQREGEVIKYRILKDMFSYSGRVSLKTYWVSFMILLIPASLLGGVVGALIWQPLLYVVWFVAFHAIFIKRLQDLGQRLEWVLVPAAYLASMICFHIVALPSIIRGDGQSFPLLTLVSLVSGFGAISIVLISFFLPGKNCVNRYGPQTSQIKVQFP